MMKALIDINAFKAYLVDMLSVFRFLPYITDLNAIIKTGAYIVFMKVWDGE